MRGCRRLTWGAWNDCDAGNRRPACGLRPGRSRARRHAVAAQRPDRLGDRPERGRLVWVMGGKGGGKTPLLAAAMGLLPARGVLRLDGQDLHALDVQTRVERGLCLVPE